jgi:hypothetical protein
MGISVNDTQVKTGFTPLSFAARNGSSTYTVTAAGNFGDLVFDHWENGSANPARQATAGRQCLPYSILQI